MHYNDYAYHWLLKGYFVHVGRETRRHHSILTLLFRDHTRIMSTSTTTQVFGGTVHELLQAYNVHHTGHEEERPPTHIRHPRLETSANAPEQEAQLIQHQDQPRALASRRRVPAYRATSREHALSSRPAGLNYVESTVVVVLFLGVYVIGVSLCNPDSLMPMCF